MIAVTAPLLTAIVVAVLGLFPFAPVEPNSTEDPIRTVRLPLDNYPADLDPSVSADWSSIGIMEQMFIGLVDVNDTTAAITPELATTWTVSPNGRVYTFTLRDDARWSDGSSLTAQDIRYGLLRTLDPNINSLNAPNLFMIENAQAYHDGMVGPDDVAIEADGTSLVITLAQPTTGFLLMMAQSFARPVPEQAIVAHGAEWTQPGNIVVSGAYTLVSEQEEGYVLFDKNPAYFDAAAVQIDRIRYKILDASADLWAEYVAGNIDFVEVPGDAPLDVGLQQQVTVQTEPCTYYYGFTTTLPPFDNPLVRKAFAAAVPRNSVTRYISGGAQPALTYISPGIDGYTDGHAESLGIRHDPEQAREWLAQAGFPNGAGLPEVTLWYNTSDTHAAIADIVVASWRNSLGAQVQTASSEWADFRGRVGNGEFQVWRMGWCADYNDGLNFLDTGIGNDNRFGGWSNPGYENLVNQLYSTLPGDEREARFRRAEEILIEEDAVLIPIYFYGERTATKPYLVRTASVGGRYDISEWQMLNSEIRISASGGSLTSVDERTTATSPAGAFDAEVSLYHEPIVATTLPQGKGRTAIAFSLDAYADDGTETQPNEGSTLSIVVDYEVTDIAGVNEESLALYYWDGAAWVLEPTSEVDVSGKTVTATPDHLSDWALLGDTHPVFLPQLSR